MKKKPVVLYDQFIYTHMGTWISGQLVYDNFPKPRKTKSTVSFFLKTFRSFRKRPCRNQRFTLSIGNQDHHVTSDEFGFYSLFLDDQYPPQKDIQYRRGPNTIFRHSEINIFDYRDKDGLLISDVDDTILLSYSTKMRKRLRNMFFINPEKRKMIEGASEFLNKVKRMNYGVIYLSNSESNLQPILNRFINTNEFPEAPLLLSRYLYWKDVFDKDIHHYKKTHKIESLLSICEYFEKIPLVLVGDSGQKDLSTYHEIASQYPERVQNILIHELPWKPNSEIIEGYREKLKKMNITVELFDTSYASINSFGSEE